MDVIFPLTLDAMNGMRSRVAAGANMREGDPEFYRMIALLRKIIYPNRDIKVSPGLFVTAVL